MSPLSEAGAWLFQIGVGAIFSFAGAIALAALGCWGLRLRPGRLRLLVLALPLAKLVQTVIHGIPADAFFWLRMAGSKREIGSFMLGFGFERPFIPLVRFVIGAVAGGQNHPDSAADVLAVLLERKLSPALPAAIGIGFAVVGLARVTVAAARTLRTTPRRAAIDGAARRVEVRRLDVRRVDVLVRAPDPGAPVVPFAGGLLRPYVCFAAPVWDRLTPAEREAVVLHELAHHRFGDLLFVGVVAAVGALFWFVPGVLPLARRIRAECELAADSSAVAAGAAPEALASSLVKVAEVALETGAAPPPAPLAFGGSAELLRRRIGALLEPAARSPRLVTLLRFAGALVVGAAVFRAITFGQP